MHIFNYLGNKDEIYLRFRVAGYIWGIEKFRRRQIGKEVEEDKEVKIKDRDLIGNSFCVRVM
jgi:hypothetical protein